MTTSVDATGRVRLSAAIFAAFSLAAVLIGAFVAARNGASTQALGLNLAAWVVGGLLAVSVARLPIKAVWVWMGLTVAALVLTLVSPGLSGVHRWFAIGPVRLNVAELWLPIALAACAGLDRGSLARLLFPLVIALLLSLQPDLSQAAAVAAAGVVVAVTSTRPLAARILIALALAAALVAAALRPDPLGPVAVVEGIVRLAATISPLLAALGVVAIAGAMVAPLLMARAAAAPVRDAALSLTAYLAVAALAPAFGAFPVPWMGIGVSPILGAWLGMGWMMRLHHAAN